VVVDVGLAEAPLVASPITMDSDDPASNPAHHRTPDGDSERRRAFTWRGMCDVRRYPWPEAIGSPLDVAGG